jgi:LacI family transcriptional regulator, galactose operon repressor
MSDDSGQKRVRREVTLSDVAKDAGVHSSTVSRSLDPAAENLVNSATRERVLASAKALGYRPDQLASSLRRGRTNTVGVIVPDLGNTFWAPVLRGLTDSMDEYGYVSYIADSHDENERLARTIDSFLARKVDVLIIGAARKSTRQSILQFADQGTPILLIVRDLPRSGLPVISHDDVGGGAIAADHLLELGHVRVAQLRGPDDISSFNDRSRGFSKVVEAAGIHEIGLEESATAPTHEQGEHLMQLVLEQKGAPPTAVFAQNDLLALGAITALRRAGLSVPRDVSVIGYNDVPLLHHFDPALTTVRLPGEELGEIAGGEAMRILRGEKVRRQRVAPELVVRGSTGPPP